MLGRPKLGILQLLNDPGVAAKRRLKIMIPKSLKGRIFVGLTFLNFGIASFFAGLGELQQVVFSGITAVICYGIWWAEVAKENKDD
jgi:hypothetical protein